MDEKRKGEIAIALLKYKARQEGITISAGTNRELGNVAKETGIPQNELKEFLKIFMKELCEQIL